MKIITKGAKWGSFPVNYAVCFSFSSKICTQTSFRVVDIDHDFIGGLVLVKLATQLFVDFDQKSRFL